ncbi:MAG TPA: hypothetical protein VGB37_06440 [Candidatus Lokiarchaeia archaeon]
MINQYLSIIIGIFLLIAGLLDAYKYSLQAFKIQKIRTAKGQSRKFNDISFIFKIACIVDGIYTQNWYLVGCAAVGLLCVCHLFYVTYLYYPYRYRGLYNFVRPNFIKYTINSVIPNNKRKRL